MIILNPCGEIPILPSRFRSPFRRTKVQFRWKTEVESEPNVKYTFSTLAQMLRQSEVGILSNNKQTSKSTIE